MKSLKNAIEDRETFDAATRDCVALIESEVASKSGLSGMAIKAGFATLRGLRPGFLEHVVRGLLPEFAGAIDPIAAEATGDVEQHLVANAGRVADALLAITDAKAERSQNRAAKSAYGRLRGSAKQHVEAVVPRLAELIVRYAR
ncbi:MAG: hypothetical protein GXY23_09500 [Myxococcales bacterium]|nr:hypothetical protein [Myxococcales bacterium]